MNIKIEKMTSCDKDFVIDMMKVFYSSEAVLTNGSDEIFKADVEACVGDNPYLEGFVFKDDNNYLGYAMTAKSFSTEFGKHCIWLEDLYLKPEYRGNGIAKKFFEFLFETYPDSIFKLEVEKENKNAFGLYKKYGFDEVTYITMINR